MLATWKLALLSLLLVSTQYAIATFQKQRQSPPNFVLILADDLDWTLGGTNASTLQKTQHLIGDHGTRLSNWFVQTPVCCASRAELFTGRLFHNLRVPNATCAGCMHVDVADDPGHVFWKDYYFANYFATANHSNSNLNLNLNYKVGIFGKHLNTHNPTNFVPNGVDEMLINGGGEYLNPTFVHGRKRKLGNNNAVNNNNATDDIQVVRFDNCTASTGMPCYSTSVIGNSSLAWIQRQATHQNPFLALISVKAPHIQDGNGFPMAVPAPWYANTSIPETKAPRTKNYNVTNAGHHWLVRSQPPLTTLEAQKVDELYVSRLKTLLSVDDLVQDLVTQLDNLGVLNNTYILFTSDNGYRLGQFRIPQCKLHPYENDVRVPMLIRGPGIGQQSEQQSLFSHVHLLPTLLGLATGEHDSQEILPKAMDGTNLASVLLHEDELQPDNIPNEFQQTRSTTATPFSSVSMLMEYTSLGNVVRYQHRIDTFNHSFVALRILQNPTTSSYYTTSVSTKIDQISNLKYIEFRDSRLDWTNTEGPPLERELYDLDQDPFELDNLLEPMRVSVSLLQALEKKMDRLIRCSGETCRREHSTGLEGMQVDAQVNAKVS